MPEESSEVPLASSYIFILHHVLRSLPRTSNEAYDLLSPATKEMVPESFLASRLMAREWYPPGFTWISLRSFVYSWVSSRYHFTSMKSLGQMRHLNMAVSPSKHSISSSSSKIRTFRPEWEVTTRSERSVSCLRSFSKDTENGNTFVITQLLVIYRELKNGGTLYLKVSI